MDRITKEDVLDKIKKKKTLRKRIAPMIDHTLRHGWDILEAEVGKKGGRGKP